MRLIVTALTFLIGLFLILLGIAYLVQPDTVAAGVGLRPLDNQGFSTLRGDVFAFFTITGICTVWGAWQRKGDLLLVPAIVMILVILGRIVSLAMDGSYDGFVIPMLAEAVIAGIVLWARNLLPHHHLDEVGD